MESDEHSTPHWMSAHFGTLGQCSVYPTAPVLLTKDSPRNEISYDSQPPFSLHSASISRILEPNPQGLISSVAFISKSLLRYRKN